MYVHIIKLLSFGVQVNNWHTRIHFFFFLQENKEICSLTKFLWARDFKFVEVKILRKTLLMVHTLPAQEANNS